MAILEILKHPDPFLKKVVKKVKLEQINESLQKKLDDMFETMYENNGGGLAANQVGFDMRLFIMDGSEDKSEQIVVINPDIIESKGEVVDEEGCLSFPNVNIKVKRASWVKISAYDREGNHFEMSADGYLGRCIQHEIDHLNGITFFDRVSALKRKMAEKKYKKANS